MYNKQHCSPKALNNNNSCLNNKLILKLANILNNNPNCNINVDESTDLYKDICNNIKNISKCNSEYCWLTISDIVNNLTNSEIKEFKESFRPSMPKEWKDNFNEWLSTTDINKVLLQYEEANPEFEYLGAHPIDAHKCSVSDEVCSIDIIDLLNKNKTKVGIVFNTDDSTGEGEHWVSFYVDLKGINRKNKPSIYFFDSTGDEPQKEIDNLAKKIRKQCKKIKLDLDYVVNDIQHQREDTECGIYSIYFITEMLKGKDFNKFVKNIKDDKFMEKYRKIFYLN